MGGNKTSPKNQSKLIKFIKTPLRILSRTKNFYIQSMTNCTGRMTTSNIIGCSMGPAGGGLTTLPKSFSVNSSISRNSIDSDLRELIRVTSQKNNSLKDKVMAEIIQQQEELKQKQMKNSAKLAEGLGRSQSSSVVGLIGRIDENKANSFRKDSEVESFLYPRSKSHGISKRTVGSVSKV